MTGRGAVASRGAPSSPSLVVIPFVVPFVWLVASAFKPIDQFYAAPPTLFPDPPSLANLQACSICSTSRACSRTRRSSRSPWRSATVLVVVGRRVRLRDAAGARRAAAVRRPDRDHPHPADGRDRPPVHPVQPDRLGRHVPAAHRPEPVRQRVRDLPVPPVVPEPPAEPVRERRARRREPAPGVPPHRPAAGLAGGRGRRGVRVRRVVERLPRAARLPPLARHVHGQPRHGDVPGRPRQRRPPVGRDGVHRPHPADRRLRRAAAGPRARHRDGSAGVADADAADPPPAGPARSGGHDSCATTA